MYYVGSSANPKRRLDDHNQGRVKATKNKGPWVLKFFQEFSTVSEARQIEYKIKKLKRRDILEKIIKDGYIKIKVVWDAPTSRRGDRRFKFSQ